MDTLRADTVERRMPYLTSLAARGTSFRNAIAPASWTMPSLTSFLTGLPPHIHRCVELGGTINVRKEVVTFAEALGKGYGYDTAAFIGLPAAAAASTIFDGYGHVTPDFSLQGMDTVVVPWLKQRDAKKPLLLLLHTYDVHEPYGAANQPWPKPKTAAAFADGDPLEGVAGGTWEIVRRCLLDWRACLALKSMRYRSLQDDYLQRLWSGLETEPQPALAQQLHEAYEAGAEWVDKLLKSTVERLEAAGVLRDAVLVVTSDHGEAFGEHGMLLHGRQLYEELLRIPLVIAPFGAAQDGPFGGRRVHEECVGLVDVFPTLLAGLKFAPVGEGQGRSFLGELGGASEAPPVISEIRVTPQSTGGLADQQVMSARTRTWKYILTCDFGKGTVREDLFDLRTDPNERAPIPLNAADSGSIGTSFSRAIEQVRDHFWRGANATTVTCDLPGTPDQPVNVPRPPPLLPR